MTNHITFDDVHRALVDGSGADDATALFDELKTQSFDELGYDSLAVLETGLRLRRETGATVADADIAGAQTADELVMLINDSLSAGVAKEDAS